jgi:autotransporter adhesin
MKNKRYCDRKKLSALIMAVMLGVGFHGGVALAGTELGGGTTAGTTGSIAVGGNDGTATTANFNYAIAIGSGSTAGAANAIALGAAANAGGESSVSIGSTSVSLGLQSVAVGVSAKSAGDYSVAMGSSASSAGSEAVAIGKEAKADNAGAVAIGSLVNSRSTGAYDNSVAVGYNAATSGANAVAIGNSGTAGAAEAVAIGYNTNASAKGAIAIGSGNSTTQVSSTGINAIALGALANSSQENSLALGANSVASNSNSVALGASSTTGDVHDGSTAQKLTVAGTDYDFAGLATAANGSVSVGKAGAERQIQNVAAGNISATSTDAVNGSQLNAVAAALNATLDGGLTVAGDTNTTGSEVKLNNKISINGNGATSTSGYSTNNIMTKEETDGAGGAVVGIYMSDTPTFNSVTSGTFTTSGANTISISGATGTITGLKNTTYDSANIVSGRAATEGELKSAVDALASSTASEGLVVAGDTNTTGDTVKLGKKISIKGNGNTDTTGYSTDNIMTSETADGADGSVIKLYMSDTPTFTSVNAGTFTTSGANTITISGATGTITGLTNTTFDSANIVSGRAATEGQLQSLQTEITAAATDIDYVKSDNTTNSTAASVGKNAAALGYGSNASGENSTAVGNGSKATTDNSVALGANSETAAAHTDTSATQGTITGTDGKTTTQTYAGAATSSTGTVSVGTAGAERQIQNVAAGDISSTSTDAVNGSQLWTTNQNVSNLSDRVDTVETAMGSNSSTLKNLQDSVDKGISFSGNTGSYDLALGNKFNIKGGGTKADSEYSSSNIKTTVDGNTLTIKVDNNPTFNTITTGSGSSQVVLGNGGVSVGGKSYITSSGLNANGQKITNVAAGKVSADSTDAVNGSQLYAANQEINKLTQEYQTGGAKVTSTEVLNKIDQLDNRVNEVGAGAAALGSLHPLDYDPNYKWDIAAGYGGYKNAHAAALGAFYRPGENFMLSLGSTIGYNNNIYAVGMSYKFGAPTHSLTSTSRVNFAKNVSDLLQSNKVLENKNIQQNAQLQSLRADTDKADAEIAKLKEQVARLLAK